MLQRFFKDISISRTNSNGTYRVEEYELFLYLNVSLEFVLERRYRQKTGAANLESLCTELSKMSKILDQKQKQKKTFIPVIFTQLDLLLLLIGYFMSIFDDFEFQRCLFCTKLFYRDFNYFFNFLKIFTKFLECFKYSQKQLNNPLLVNSFR